MHMLLKVGAVSTAVVSMLAGVGATKTADPYCNVASTWVKEHLKDLPTSYTEISKYPLIYRKYIASALPRETRNELWKEHLASFATSQPGLNREQAELLQFVIANESIVFDSVRGKQWMESERITSRAKALFGAEKAKAIFATLGPVPENVTNLQVNTASVFGPTSMLTRIVRSIPVGATGGAPNCDCSTESDWCDGDSVCKTKPTNCVTVPHECGTVGAYDCNGLCYGTPARPANGGN